MAKSKFISCIIGSLVFLIMMKTAYNHIPSDFQWLVAFWTGMIYMYFLQKVINAN